MQSQLTLPNKGRTSGPVSGFSWRPRFIASSELTWHLGPLHVCRRAQLRMRQAVNVASRLRLAGARPHSQQRAFRVLNSAGSKTLLNTRRPRHPCAGGARQAVPGAPGAGAAQGRGCGRGRPAAGAGREPAAGAGGVPGAAGGRGWPGASSGCARARRQPSWVSGCPARRAPHVDLPRQDSEVLCRAL